MERRADPATSEPSSTGGPSVDERAARENSDARSEGVQAEASLAREGDGLPTEPGKSGGGGGGGESAKTVLVAVLANAGIAVAKGVAASFSGSAALWAETAHSVADTANELLLFVGLHRSSKAPDARHPYGYGQERYFYALLAALGIFLVGGLLSVAEGVRSLFEGGPLDSPWIAIGVLLVSAVLEGASWRQARKQLRSEAEERKRSMVEHMNVASDPTPATVFLEDSAALIGLALALAAVLLHWWTGSALWDALASFGIGLLLVVVAALLARRSKGLLIDESAPPDVLAAVREQVERARWVRAVEHLIVVFVGPGQLTVRARVSPVADLREGRVPALLEDVDALRQDLLANPAIVEVDVTVVP
ncbi:MAG: cation diffusion facilitator family transporter [Motilibacteraceae bacterium]